MPKKQVIHVGGGGFGLGSLLGVVFVTLKLVGTIDWSWWWVTAPFWGPIALFFGILTTAGVIAGIVIAMAAIYEWSIKKRAG